MRRRLWGLVAGPLLISQCAPTHCAPDPAPAPAPPPVEAEPPPAAPPAPPAPAPTEQPVVPPPAATTAAWSFLSANAAGQYTRWNPCADPIRYQIDVTVAPTADERAAIAAAVATASATSGHTFELLGDGTAAQPLPGAEAMIGLRDFGPGMLGQGGGRFTASLEMVSGSAYIDTALRPDILRSTLLHEIGHLLGLGHVDDPAQLMYPVVRTPPMQDYQWGDREGMRLVGAGQPCTLSLLTRAEVPTREVLLD
jgi:hypothetical protein